MPETVEIRITGTTGRVDGHFEILLGMLALSSYLIGWNAEKVTRDDGQTELYINAVLKEPPLGHQGTIDIPERKESNDDAS